MSNIITVHEDDFLDYTPTASTEATGYPDDNVTEYKKPSKEWRSTVKTETTIVCDLTNVDQAVAAVFLHGVNFDDAYIQGHASDSWGAPSFSEQIKIPYCLKSKRYKGFFVLTDFAYRYLRLRITAQTPTDGEAFFRIGAMVICSTATAIDKNPSYGSYKQRAVKPAIEVEYEGGSKDFVTIGLHRRYETEMAFASPSCNMDDIWEKWNLDLGSILVLYENSLHGSDESSAWLLRLESQVDMTWEAYEYANMESLVFTEIV